MAAPKSTSGRRNATSKPAEPATPNTTEQSSAKDAPEAKAATEDEIEGIWVRSVKTSFRRCGMRFTREGFGVAMEELEEGQLETLEQEPNLVVERMTFTDERMTR